MSQSSAIVERLWNYCTVLRDDGLSYGDYVEQLTYLLFLKMDDERRKIGDPSTIPNAYSWASLVNLDGSDLEIHYRKILQELGQGRGLIHPHHLSQGTKPHPRPGQTQAARHPH